jgi:signal transduction histidine kinase
VRIDQEDGDVNRRRSGAAGRLLLVPRAFVAAMAGSALVVGVVVWLVFMSVPQVELSLATTADGRWTVSGVPVGERAWLVGIRPGMEVESFAPSDARSNGNWTSLAVSDGVVHLTVQRFYPPPDAIWAPLSLVALVGSVFAIGVASSVAWWLLLAPSLIALAVALDLVTMPVSLLVGLAPPAIGALSLSDPGRRLDSRLVWIGAGLISLAGGCWLIAYVLRFESWAFPRQASAAVGIGLLSLGTAASVRQALWRARTRLNRAGDHSPPAFVLLASTLDELVPGRARSRLSAMERERAAIATDLHGDVLPDLAAIIKSVEAGMNQADTAGRLRSMASELRELMTERRLTVLEELGLVPALEWLAERVEERTNVTVEIDIRGDGAARVPPDVELHVYRIAQQALDNALAHARPSKIWISIDIEAERLDLEVVDDGAGIEPGAEGRALRAGRVGIADMRQRATGIGGALSIGRLDAGTMVALRWPA